MTITTQHPEVDLIDADELLYEFEALKASGRLDYWGGPIDTSTWPLLDMRGWMYLNVHLDPENFRVIYDLVNPDSTRGCSARYNVDGNAKVPRLVERLGEPDNTLPLATVPPSYRISLNPALTLFGRPVLWRSEVKVYSPHKDDEAPYYFPILFGHNWHFTRKGIERSAKRTAEGHRREVAPLVPHGQAETIYA